jgi:hypothetical protein
MGARPADVPEEAAAARGTLVPHIQRRRRVEHCAEHVARDGGRDGVAAASALRPAAWFVVVGPFWPLRFDRRF